MTKARYYQPAQIKPKYIRIFDRQFVLDANKISAIYITKNEYMDDSIAIVCDGRKYLFDNTKKLMEWLVNLKLIPEEM